MTNAINSLEAMLMLGLIVSLIVIGLIAGGAARLLVPGGQDISAPRAHAQRP